MRTNGSLVENVRASVFIASLSFAMYVADRLTRAARRQEATQSQAASAPAGMSARTGEPGRGSVRMPDTGTTDQGIE